MLTDSVPISALISQGVLVGGEGWDNTDYFGMQITKGITVKQVKKSVVETEVKERGKVTLDDSKLVELGGPFEKIGEEDESVGGDYKKVG